jgi:hypothetical protein
MEKFRIEAAQKMFKEAGKFKNIEKLKNPKKGYINVDLYVEVLYDLIDTEDFIYSSRPQNKLDKDEAKLFCDRILKIRDKLDLILTEFGVIDKKSLEKEIKSLSEKFLFITTKNNYKKIISNFGVDPQKIIVAGVPLDVEDINALNPKIPKSAYKSIRKKIEIVKNDINRKMDFLNLDKVLVVVEQDKAGEILGLRAKELYAADMIQQENLKKTTVDEFLYLISKI